MAEKLLTPSQNIHWYKADGTPAYNAGVVQARKEGLFPSVTAILGVIDKFNIGVWKQEQAIHSVFDALDDAWKKILGEGSIDLLQERVFRFWKEELRIDNPGLREAVKAHLEVRLSMAASLGSRIHDLIECYLLKQPVVPQGKEETEIWVEVCKWLNTHIVNGDSEKTFANKCLRYAGRIDFDGVLCNMSSYCGENEFNAVVDFKTQNVKDGKPAYWDDYAYQLAAYRKKNSENDIFVEGEENKKCVTVLISTSPDFRGVTAKVWPETEEDKKVLGIRSGITLQDGWNVFYNAMRLFFELKKI